MKPRPSRTRFGRRLFLPVAFALSAATASAAEPIAPIAAASRSALWWGDFAALEKQNNDHRQPGRIAADGTSALYLFRTGLGIIFNYNPKNPEPYLKELDALTLQWARQYPRSALAHALHARALLAHGQSYRGTSYANDVPPEAWAPYRDYLTQAATYLKDHAEVALTDSYAHYILINIGRGLGWEHEQLEAIAQEGLKRNPEDDDLYFAVLGALLPKWGGNAKLLDRYIMQATEQTRARYGWGMYAWMYSVAARDQYGSGLFENSHANWDKMKLGYEDMLARYPDSAVRRNRYAYLACIAKDRTTLLRLLGDIGSNVRTEAWGRNPERAVETCRHWASQL